MRPKSDIKNVYSIIYEDFRKKIFSGELKPGDLLPSENSLCTEYSASRETVRKGLGELNREGLIFSRPKIGYFVSEPNYDSITLNFSEQAEHLQSNYNDIHGILPDEYLQKALDIPANLKVIEFLRIFRLSDGEPIACEIKYVPYERAYPSVESEIKYAVLPDITSAKIASYEFYTDVVVSAVKATERIANILECNVGDALLLTERTFITQDGRRIGYSLYYSRGQLGKLYGTAGYKV